MKNPNKQRGAAIIVALFVVALVAAAATIMIERFRTDVRRTELILNANTAYLYAQGSIAWAIDRLNQNLADQQPNAVVDKTPIVFPEEDKDGTIISSTLYDAQGFFNINSLTEQSFQPCFTRLLKILNPTLDEATALAITAGIVDWISQNGKNPVFDEYYLKSTPSYRSPHRPMASISELRLVKGVTPDIYLSLTPYLSALPSPTMININNADIPVLMSLSPTLQPQGAKVIRDTAKANPFPNTESFQNFEVVKNNTIEPNKITTLSNYFLLETSVKLGNQKLAFYALLERSMQGSKSKTTVLWQSKGVL